MSDEKNKDQGILYVVGTPIGNLEDISLRALNVLKTVDIIAAEDTRHTLKMLNNFEIKKQLISYHKDNIINSGKNILKLIGEGKKIALVSDAGMPGISDPGEDLVKVISESGYAVSVIPGPTASIVGLILSGFKTDRFVFEGFLPTKNVDRKKRLEEIEIEEKTTILYESPHSLLKTLIELFDTIGNRKIAVLRELTKIYEERIKGNLEDVIDIIKKRKIKGEIVIVIEGCSKSVKSDKKKNLLSIEQHYNEYINEGYNKKEALKKVAMDRDVPKKEIYSILFIED